MKDKHFKNSIELEITLRCNSYCSQCSRHCNILNYGNTDMSLNQINKFINQVEKSNQILNRISIMGGEPTLHPKLSIITQKLYNKLFITGKVKHLVIATNGLKNLPISVKKLPISIAKSSPNQKKHRCQFIAPKDTYQKTCFCKVPYSCGMALNTFGYFPCGAGGAIIRLFRLKKFIKYDFPQSPENFIDFRNEVCSLCQRYAKTPLMFNETNSCTPSESFQKSLDEFKNSPPIYVQF